MYFSSEGNLICSLILAQIWATKARVFNFRFLESVFPSFFPLFFLLLFRFVCCAVFVLFAILVLFSCVSVPYPLAMPFLLTKCDCVCVCANSLPSKCVFLGTHTHTQSSGLQAKLLRIAKVSIAKGGRKTFTKQGIRNFWQAPHTQNFKQFPKRIHTCVLVFVFFVRVTHTKSTANVQPQLLFSHKFHFDVLKISLFCHFFTPRA